MCLFGPILFSSCVSIPPEPPAKLVTTVFPSALEALPSSPPDTPPGAPQEWVREYRVGKVFAQEQDFYRAATCFHRARILLPKGSPYRQKLVYALILTYSISRKYQEAITLWEREGPSLTISEPKLAYDYICLLYEAYIALNRPENAKALLQSLPQGDPLLYKLPLFSLFASNTESAMQPAMSLVHPLGTEAEEEAKKISLVYRNSRKNPATAKTLNALLPGAGYAYIRQYQTATTALALNALFIASSVQFLLARQPAAGLLAAGFEVGWYAGGITGVALATEQYNQKLREQLTRPFLEKYRLFPLTSLHYQW